MKKAWFLLLFLIAALLVPAVSVSAQTTWTLTNPGWSFTGPTGSCPFLYTGAPPVKGELLAYCTWTVSGEKQGVSWFYYTGINYSAGGPKLSWNTNVGNQTYAFVFRASGSTIYGQAFQLSVGTTYYGFNWNEPLILTLQSNITPAPDLVFKMDGYGKEPYSVTFELYLYYQDVPKQNCWDNYQIGQLVSTGSVKAYNGPLGEGEIGKALGIQGGKYYALEITDPAWIDGDVHDPNGLARYDAAITPYWMPVLGSDEWYNVMTYPGGCWQPLDEYKPGKGRLYFYAEQSLDNTWLYGIRAQDPNGNWNNNSGSLNYKINEAIYTPPPTACEAKYDIGEQISQNRIPAWYYQGGPIFVNASPIPNQSYVLEISGEPWYDENNKPHHEVDISYDGGVTWTRIDNVNFDCVSTPGGATKRIYFTYVAGQNIRLRAGDGNDPLNYIGNKGYVKFSVNIAKDFRAGICTDKFTLGQQVASGSVSAQLSIGGTIAYQFQIGNWYAIEITAPAWSDNGTERKGAQIAAISGWTTWYGLANYPGVACAEDVNGYTRVYMKAQYAQYLLRADDPTESFANNSGSVNYKVYSVTPSPTLGNPINSCEQAYNTSRIVVSMPILYANLENGVELKLQPGLYMLETMEGPWLNEQTPSYDIEMTDGGLLGQYVPVSLSGIAPPIECVVQLSDGVHYRVYFRVEVGKNYRVRVYDPQGTFATNSGYLVLGIYRITRTGEEPPKLGDYTVNGCNSVCVRPDSVLEVPAWIEYARCAFSKWLSWCPYHTAAIVSLLGKLNEHEPFATLLAFTSLPEQIKAEFVQFQWSQDVGGDLSDLSVNMSQPWDLLAKLPESNPLNTGKIDLTRPATPASRTCQNEMTKAVGSKLAGPVCFALNTMNQLGVTKWIQFIFDVTMVAIFGLYIWNVWIKQIGN